MTKIKKTLFPAIVLLLVVLAVGLAYSGTTKVTTKVSVTVEETIGNGKINWEKGTIIAIGMGASPANMPQAQAKLMARRAAIADAERILAEITNGVRVSSETYVKNFVTESDEIRTKVTGFIKGFQITNEKFNAEDGTYEVTAVLPMYGQDSLGQIIYPEITDEKTVKTFRKQNTVTVDYIRNTLSRTFKNQPQKVATTSSATTYTGVIVDTIGLGVKPAMSPKLLADTGSEIYGTMQISTKLAIEWGVVAYAKNIDNAKKFSRVGKNPIIIKAVNKTGTLSANPIITDKDGNAVKSFNQAANFFKNCGVAFVVD